MGVDRHPDHQHATNAALAPDNVAHSLNRELDTTFAGRGEDQLDFTITVDRSHQLEAIRQHRSQSTDS